jgi:hypothetical protein
MSKVQDGSSTSNARGAGTRRQHGDPFGELHERVQAFERGDDKGTALSSFVEALSAAGPIVRGPWSPKGFSRLRRWSGIPG